MSQDEQNKARPVWREFIMNEGITDVASIYANSFKVIEAEPALTYIRELEEENYALKLADKEASAMHEQARETYLENQALKDKTTCGYCDFDRSAEAKIKNLKLELAESNTKIKELQFEINNQMKSTGYKMLEEQLADKTSALEAINKAELNAQRPGGGYSTSAKLSFGVLKKWEK